MEISFIKIRNYRSLKDPPEINPTKLFALIGKNNTGKSAILKAIQVLWGQKDVELTDFHKDEELIEISILLKGERYKSEENPSGEMKVSFRCSKDLKKIYILNDKPSSEKNIGDILPELLVINDIRDPGDSTTEGNKSTLLKKILKEREDTKISKDLIQKIEQTKIDGAKEISDLITDKFKDIIDSEEYTINISPDINIEKGVNYHTNLINKKIPDCKPINILNCGTGLQSMYILALLETLAEKKEVNKEAILLIEEPEVYLHPEFQRRMFKALRRIAENNQVIYSTHSPIMISELWATESIRQISLNDKGETTINLIKIEEVIDELGIRYEDILNPTLILFVEGGNDIKFFQKIGINDPRIKFIDSDGLRAIHYFAYIKILTSDNVRNNFRIIVDSDGLNDSIRHTEEKNKILKEFGKPIKICLDEKIIVLSEYSPESYFLEKNVLVKAFPEVPEKDISDFINIYKEEYIRQRDSKDLTIDRNRIDFQIYFNPKRIFEDYRKNEKEYNDFWNNKGDFLKTRKQIREKCNQIKINQNKPYFDHILENIDPERNLPKELIEKKEEILKLLQMK